MIPSASTVHYSHYKIALFCTILKSADGLIERKIVTFTCRDCGLAKWIKNKSFWIFFGKYDDSNTFPINEGSAYCYQRG